jgi:hypothetical protein
MVILVRSDLVEYGRTNITIEPRVVLRCWGRIRGYSSATVTRGGGLTSCIRTSSRQPEVCRTATTRQDGGSTQFPAHLHRVTAATAMNDSRSRYYPALVEQSIVLSRRGCRGARAGDVQFNFVNLATRNDDGHKLRAAIERNRHQQGTLVLGKYALHQAGQTFVPSRFKLRCSRGSRHVTAVACVTLFGCG